jgi:uncharacterized protein YceK
MKKVLALSVLAAAISLSGCVIKIDDDGYDSSYSSYSDWEKREKKNRRYIADLDLQTAKDVIKNDLGAPDFNEVFAKDDDKVQILYYRTQRTDDDGLTTKDECTPLVFVNDELKGWGESAVKRYL